MYYKGFVQSEEVHDPDQSRHSPKEIANDCGFMKGEPAEVLDNLLDIVKKRLIAGDDVMISGFGKWTVKSKHARRGRNPKTGEEVILGARKVVTWKYSPVLKKAVNGVEVR